ncbi:hypothetical protein GCM10010254_69860 [Streptomyces chromofuscus]|nr:hypothetical protein GCM10010254_69860 [Streptomyces chromofuscus]
MLAAPSATAAGAWTEIGSDRADPLAESQGPTSVEVPAGSSNRYPGIGTVPASVSSRGWNHVQQPRLEPRRRPRRLLRRPLHQDVPGAVAGRRPRSEFVHTFGPGEGLNNSWVAISPGGPWTLAGGYGTVHLDHAVRDVRGCDVTGPTTLLCSSDDPAGRLFGITRPLLRIDLSAAPDGTSDVSGRVTALRQLPLRGGCSGTYEAEGIDYDRRTGTLRVIVLSPGFCILTDSKTYRFTES